MDSEIDRSFLLSEMIKTDEGIEDLSFILNIPLEKFEKIVYNMNRGEQE